LASRKHFHTLWGAYICRRYRTYYKSVPSFSMCRQAA
jgi:hypothetical protein